MDVAAHKAIMAKTQKLLPSNEPEEPPAWPDPVEYLDFALAQIPRPLALIEGILDAASRMIFGGGSKTYKTWAMSDLALSIAAGAPWLGFQCHHYPVLYVNFELKPYYMQQRLRAIRVAKELALASDQLHIWNLRGHCDVTLLAFKAKLLELIEKYQLLVVFIDPFYKLLGTADERVSAELNPILAAFDEINRLTGCTVVCAAHYTKGNQASKDPLDRISGGGSISRDPDNLICFTNHQEAHCFVMDFTLRDYESPESFVVKWNYPLLVRTELDPAKLRKPGPTQKCDAGQLLEFIRSHDDELSTTELRDHVSDELGWGKSTFYDKLSELKEAKVVFNSKISKCWNVSNHR
jgi:hypothetical protein